MQDLFHLASEIQSFCQVRGWRFCFIGGIALQRWGEPRLTGDVDLTILTGFGCEAEYIEELCGTYAGRIPDAAGFALRSRVLLLRSERGIPIDISLGALRFEERVINRATFYRFLTDVRLNTCSAEDLIVLKAFADRFRDWSDIEGVLLRTGHRLAWETVETELPPLCEAKEAPQIMPRLQALRDSLGECGRDDDRQQGQGAGVDDGEDACRTGPDAGHC